MSASLAGFALAALFLAAGAVAVHRLRLPPLPAYLIMGLAFGGRFEVATPGPVPAVGLILLLFSIGQEFGPERLREFSRRGWRAGAWDAAALPIGATLGLAVGLDPTQAVLLGCVFYASSSAVVAKLIIDLRRTGYPESDIVLGVLVIEDVVLALVLTFVGSRTGYAGFAASVILAATYLAAGWFLAPLLVRHMAALSDELALLSAFAATVGTAMLFAELGASEAVGAFLCGVVAAGLGFQDRFERLVGPVRDLAVAFFFFAVGVQAVGTLSALTGLAIALSLVALAAKLPLDYQAGKAAGLGHRPARVASLLLLPRGEFNLVIATLAMLAEGGSLVGQVAVLTVLISIPLGTILARYAPDLSALFERGAAQRPAGLSGGRSPDIVA
ncbi:MAG TPA: cation:proton antiporter [Crenalkalicoccus sp.]|nr:cation:proton antiporter [Crenalkalicoccus sp.]